MTDKLKDAGKGCKISGFSDPVISKGRVIIDLIDAIKPGSVKENVVKAGDNGEVYAYMYVIVDKSYIVNSNVSEWIHELIFDVLPNSMPS